MREPGLVEWGFGVNLVMLQGRVCWEAAANFVVVGPAALKRSEQSVWYSELCNIACLGLACTES